MELLSLGHFFNGIVSMKAKIKKFFRRKFIICCSFVFVSFRDGGGGLGAREICYSSGNRISLVNAEHSQEICNVVKLFSVAEIRDCRLHFDFLTSPNSKPGYFTVLLLL